MATVAPPVTQNSMSSKGPTAMVFMNMGGPAKTDDVGDFLSRLFVSSIPYPSLLHALTHAIYRRMETLSHSVDCNPTLDP
jgi:ferrochelatase